VSELTILPIHGIGDIRPGDDLAELIANAAPWLRDGDVVVVTSKVVSKAEGRLAPAENDGKEAALKAETARPVARRGPTRIVQTHHGFVMANAGIDASNVDASQLVLLPLDPDASAARLRTQLKQRGHDVAVVVSDTMGRPWRLGLVDVALGASGIEAIRDYRGSVDPYGNELQITQIAIVDEIAAAADLVKGKTDGVPVAVVRGLAYNDSTAGAKPLIRGADQDLFSLGTAEARAEGLRAAANLADAVAFADVPITLPPLDPRMFVRVTGPARDKLCALLPPGTAEVVVPVAGDDAWSAAQTGSAVHRLRAELAAAGLSTVWVRADEASTVDVIPLPSGSRALGLLGVGVGA
jgi:coenzyme F420-0:L-glutamate ligase / coenzyme F420-1:gamma-L-glutamate ligase